MLSVHSWAVAVHLSKQRLRPFLNCSGVLLRKLLYNELAMFFFFCSLLPLSLSFSLSISLTQKYRNKMNETSDLEIRNKCSSCWIAQSYLLQKFVLHFTGFEVEISRGVKLEFDPRTRGDQINSSLSMRGLHELAC